MACWSSCGEQSEYGSVAEKSEAQKFMQAKLKAYFEDYDKVHRPKSLLELHQEKKRSLGNGGAEKPRTEDLFVTKIDSKKVFRMMDKAKKIKLLLKKLNS